MKAGLLHWQEGVSKGVKTLLIGPLRDGLTHDLMSLEPEVTLGRARTHPSNRSVVPRTETGDYRDNV